MTTLELKLTLSDRLAKEAEAAGLLTARSVSKLLKDAVRRSAGERLLAGAKRASGAGSKPMSLRAIQAEVNAVRQARKIAQRRG